MITLQYKGINGEWTNVSQWPTEALCWATLGGDNYNYRTVDESGKVLTDHSNEDFEIK